MKNCMVGSKQYNVLKFEFYVPRFWKLIQNGFDRQQKLVLFY